MMNLNKVGVVSLGCSKNRVDTETLLGYLKNWGFTIVNDENEAEILIVNTCGFIDIAKEESINTILAMAQHKQGGNCKLLVATGCLVKRYENELKQELPEIDVFWGVKDYKMLAENIAKLAGKSECAYSPFNRIITTPQYSAYLRIADGCDNRCTYCAIPLIRGGRKSTPLEELIHEAKMLTERGVREITVIAQDTSAYGIDIYGKPMLSELLRKLSKIDRLDWIRVLYTYPNTVDEELIDTIVQNDKITNYIDMPIQHINDTVLKRMNRHGDRKHIEDVIKYMRKASDKFIIRSTLIVGFPGETDEQFEELMKFLRDNPLDRIGAFAYSLEDGTPAAEFDGQIEDAVKQERLSRLMRQQKEISAALNKKRIGDIVDVLIEGQNGNTALGRSYAEAPEVDASIIIDSKGKKLSVGEFAKVKLTKASDYDMWGELI